MDSDRTRTTAEAPDVDLTTRRASELLRLSDAILDELRRRDLTRTWNKPIGDIAERIVLQARGGELAPNSAKSHDIVDADGRTIQVKAMGRRSAGSAGKFSLFRSTAFDSAILISFGPGWDVAEAYEIGPDTVASATHNSYVNGQSVTLSAARSAGRDVTDEMRSAWHVVDETVRRHV